MALVVPPTAMIVHGSFNLLYQFWIHTEVIGDLGPLEYILNTSNHHRVHHGNRASIMGAYLPKFIAQRAVIPINSSSYLLPQVVTDTVWTKIMLEC